MMYFRRSICLLLCLGLMMVLFSGCGKDADATNPTTATTAGTTEPTEDEIITCLVIVQNEAGTYLDNIMVEVYSDATKADIVQAKKTDANGVISFAKQGSADGLVAVLKNVPAGYQVEDYYPLTGQNTTITLKTGAALTDEVMNSLTLSLKDAMPDFRFTASNGDELALSVLLQQYKVVVLNFWYTNCQPCKMEFPYLQEAYAQFADDVAVVAMNPMDSTNEEIEQFRQEKGYTFYMGKCDSRWSKVLNIQSYPLTVVIDRFGNITMTHSGAVDSAQMFLDIFGYFTAEDYLQSFIRSHSQLPTYESK